MQKKVFTALGLILIGIYLLLDNFDVINFSWRFVVYTLVGFWGIQLILQYQSDRNIKHLFWGLVFFFNAIWLIGANIYWSYISFEELAAVTSWIVAAAILISAVIDGHLLASIACIPFILLGFLSLNNLYLYYPDLYIDRFGGAVLGSILLSVGLFYIGTSVKFGQSGDKDSTNML